jgi:hypothetical protein
MAPRLIPPAPSFASRAEETVWRALKSKLPAEAFLAANVRLHSHEDFYEADLVVGYPGQGFAVIEVKGGQVRRTDQGWEQATPEGYQLIDPAGQADRAKRLLDSYVRQSGWGHGPIRFEHLVAFPDVDFDQSPPSPDLPRWALIARNDLDDAAGRVWDALSKRETQMPRPSADWVSHMADLLGGRPSPAATRRELAKAHQEHVDLLTGQQYSILRHLRANPRIRITGGPGSGKTWLALQQARVWADDGQLVLFVCYSRGLARWIQNSVSSFGDEISRRITVRTFHAYGMEKVGPLYPAASENAGAEFWERDLPALMSQVVRPEFDALVVDEAQDFADSWWPPLLASLRNERLLVAGDDQQAVFANRRGSPLVELATLTLDENLRNTRQIAHVFNPLGHTSMDLRGGEGAPVRFIDAPTDEVHSRAEELVEELLDAGYDAGDIAVLTTQHRHVYHREQENLVGKDGYWDGFWMDEEVFYGTVMGFKGLERPVVILAVDGFHDGVARDVMYAGMSRARDELIVIGDPDQISAAVGKVVAKRLFP